MRAFWLDDMRRQEMKTQWYYNIMGRGQDRDRISESSGVRAKGYEGLCECETIGMREITIQE